MGKPTICIGENKGADQLRSNCKADQRLCFRYSDSTIPLLLKSEISSFLLFSVLVQPGLCRTCSETTLLVFPRDGSNVNDLLPCPMKLDIHFCCLIFAIYTSVATCIYCSYTVWFNTFTDTPLKKSTSHCQEYIYFIIFSDLSNNLLIIIYLDISAYHISLKRFYAEKSDIQHFYLPLKLSSITRYLQVYT